MTREQARDKLHVLQRERERKEVNVTQGKGGPAIQKDLAVRGSALLDRQGPIR
jgi:hypothetical protein